MAKSVAIKKPLKKWCDIWWPWPLVKVTVVTRNLENIHFLTIFDNISDIIYSRVTIPGQKVACGETFKMMWHWVTLTFDQGHNNYENLQNINFENMSDSIHS